MRLVVRVQFTAAAADTKDKCSASAPARCGSVAPRPTGQRAGPRAVQLLPDRHARPERAHVRATRSTTSCSSTPAPRSSTAAAKAPGEVDFVFQVKETGSSMTGRRRPGARIAPGTFLEVKRHARVDLGCGRRRGGQAVVDKPLTCWRSSGRTWNWEGGPTPLEPGKGGAGPRHAGAPTPPAGGGRRRGRRSGSGWSATWKTGGGVHRQRNAHLHRRRRHDLRRRKARRSSAGPRRAPPQGETLDIKTAPAGGDPAGGEKRTIVFEDENQFSMTRRSGGNRRFTRVGSAPPRRPRPAPAAPSQADAAMSKMVGTWENASRLQLHVPHRRHLHRRRRPERQDRRRHVAHRRLRRTAASRQRRADLAAQDQRPEVGRPQQLEDRDAARRSRPDEIVTRAVRTGASRRRPFKRRRS